VGGEARSEPAAAPTLDPSPRTGGRRLLALAVLAICAAAPALAESVGCTPVATVRWDSGAPVEHRYDGAEFGPTLFGLDLATGKYWEHMVGSRAGVSGGGTLDIVPTVNASSHADFVGIDREDGSHLSVRFEDGRIAFMRTQASGEIDIGTCLKGDLHDAVEALPQ
jgi:hypothetical protein